MYVGHINTRQCAPPVPFGILGEERGDSGPWVEMQTDQKVQLVRECMKLERGRIGGG
jgi:hypothetical protein